MELEFVKLENRRDYILLDEIVIDGVNYLYLVDVLNANSFLIRKKVDDLLVGLADEKEFGDVLKIFIERHGNDGF